MAVVCVVCVGVHLVRSDVTTILSHISRSVEKTFPRNSISIKPHEPVRVGGHDNQYRVGRIESTCNTTTSYSVHSGTTL